jgi:hypothetical protein
MTTQYTTILKLALPVQGELSGTWGDVVNDNITQMVEQAVAGKAVINTWTANSHTLTTADGTTSESRCAILELTDSGTALTGAGTVVCPTNTKLYIVDNNTAEIITVQTAAGTGVAVPVGKTMLVYCDGTNVVEGVTHANSLSLGTSTNTVNAISIATDLGAGSSSNSNLPTQLAVKTYVDGQIAATNELSEVLAAGNVTGANDIDVDSAQKVQFRDAAIYLNSSVDGQLDIVADGEVQIDTALVDINGNLDVSGTTNISGSVSFTKNAIAGVAISTTSRASNTVTVTTSAVHGLTSGDLVNVNGVADTSFNGYFTVSVSSTTVFTYSQTGADGSSTGGTSTEVVYNLNASGTALNWMNGPLNIAANSGIDGLEITQSGAGNGLHVTGTTGLVGNTTLTGNLDVSGTTLVTGVLTTTAATVFNGGFASNADSTLGTDKKVQFRDSAIYINSSADGQLDIVADTEIQIAATTVDLNGNLDVSGTALVTGVLTTTAATVHTNGITMPDNAKAIFGAGSDLQIYHDASDSIINDNGTGSLKLQQGGSTKLEVTATGIDVTGTVTADGLTVDVGDYLMLDGGSAGEVIHTPVAGTVAIESRGSVDIYGDSNNNGTGTSGIFTVYRDSTYAGGTAKTTLNITDNGDISFYEDTGTTPKFFWDASEERLGIGTSSPVSALDLSGGADGTIGVLTLAQGNGTTKVSKLYGTSVNTNEKGLKLNTYHYGDIAALTIVSTGAATFSGNVAAGGAIGAGGVTPAVWSGTYRPIQAGEQAIAGVSGQSLQTYNARFDSAWKYINTNFANYIEVTGGSYIWNTAPSGSAGDTIIFTPRMTLTQAGNLLVGTTSAFGTTGTTINAAGLVYSSADGDRSGQFDRTGVSDGEIVRFTKAGTTVGSIQSRSGVVSTIVLDPRSGQGAGLTGAGAGGDTLRHITPTNELGAEVNGKVSLGKSNFVFKDLYLSGGVVFGDAGGSGTPASNTLDSYEEGTFSPTIVTSGSTVSYTSQLGSYTKIGRAVHFSFSLTLNVVTSEGSGTFELGGMPFASASTNINNNRYVCQTFGVDFDSSKYQFYAYTPSTSVSTLRVLYTTDNGVWTVATAATFAINNSDAIVICGTYFTD